MRFNRPRKLSDAREIEIPMVQTKKMKRMTAYIIGAHLQINFLIVKSKFLDTFIHNFVIYTNLVPNLETASRYD